MAQHVRQGLTETHGMLLYRADDLPDAVEEYLVAKCGVRRAEVVGDYRRRAEVIEDLEFIVETDDFPAAVARLQRYGGRTPLVSSSKETALFTWSSGIQLRIKWASPKNWGWSLIESTGSKAHLRKLAAVTGPIVKAQRSLP